MTRSRIVLVALAWLPLASSGQAPPGGGNDCRTPSGRCDVRITVTGPCTNEQNIRVDPPLLELAGRPNRILVWHLPPNFAFCKGSGDGVKFKSDQLDDQFSGGDATNNADGSDDAPGPNCKARYRWRDKNDPHTRDHIYRYGIQFTGPNGRCFVDPFIRNG